MRRRRQSREVLCRVSLHLSSSGADCAPRDASASQRRVLRCSGHWLAIATARFRHAPASPIRSQAMPSAVRQVARCRRAAALPRSISADFGALMQGRQCDAGGFRIRIAVAAQGPIRAVIPASIRAHVREQKLSAGFDPLAQSPVLRRESARVQKQGFRATWESPTPRLRETMASHPEILLYYPLIHLLEPVAPARFAAGLALQPCHCLVQPLRSDCLLRQERGQGRDPGALGDVRLRTPAAVLALHREQKLQAGFETRAGQPAVTDWASNTKAVGSVHEQPLLYAQPPSRFCLLFQSIILQSISFDRSVRCATETQLTRPVRAVSHASCVLLCACCGE